MTIYIRESVKFKVKDKNGKLKLKHIIEGDGTQQRIDIMRGGQKGKRHHRVWDKNYKLIHED